MGKYEKIFRELRKIMSVKEIAESMLIPRDMTPEEEKKAHEEIREFRFKLLRERTEEQRIDSDLLRLRFQTEDYLNKENFTPEKTFGKILEEYARILKKLRKSYPKNWEFITPVLAELSTTEKNPMWNSPIG